jgi:hypothetical protein
MKLSRILGIASLALFVAMFIVHDTRLSAQMPWEKERKTQNIQTFVLDSFETVGMWQAEWSSFHAKRFEQGKGYVMDDTKNAIRPFRGEPWGVTQESETNHCLAIKGAFDRRGYNYIEVFPVKLTNGQPSRDPRDNQFHRDVLPMIGRVDAIDFWVWGGNFRWRMEVHLEDYNGYKHVLDAGWLNFIGWRNFRLMIPKHIPQGEQYVPRMKTLKFEKFVFYAHPGERADVFYTFLDRIQIQSDIFLERFDGDDLVEKAYTNNAWMPKQPELRSTGR